MDPLVNNNSSNNQIPISGQRLRPRTVSARASGYGTGAQAPVTPGSTGLPTAQAIEPAPANSSAVPPLPPAPNPDFTPDPNEKGDIILGDPQPKKSPNKVLLGALAVAAIAAAFVGGMFVGKAVLGDDNQLACETSGSLPAPSDTPTPSSAPKTLTDDEIASLSNKVSYLLMGASAEVPPSSEFLTLNGIPGFRKLPAITSNNLTDADKLDIAIYSLNTEFETSENTDDEAVPAQTISVDLVQNRYAELFGSDLVEADSTVCEGWHVLSEDQSQYLINSCPEEAVIDTDLVLKSDFELDESGDAVATIIVGSALNDLAETADPALNGIYNDFAASTEKSIVTPKTDFASEEEFTAFTITSENASEFTTYRLTFEAIDSGFIFKSAAKV